MVSGFWQVDVQVGAPTAACAVSPPVVVGVFDVSSARCAVSSSGSAFVLSSVRRLGGYLADGAVVHSAFHTDVGFGSHLSGASVFQRSPRRASWVCWRCLLRRWLGDRTGTWGFENSPAAVGSFASRSKLGMWKSDQPFFGHLASPEVGNAEI